MPDAMTLHGGSFYSSSPTIGDWESFVAEDLVAYVDARYRTVPAREARGLMGHSMGGYGALRIAMKRPGVFDSVYAMSACCLFPRGAGPFAAELEQVETVEQARAAPRDWRNQLAAAAAWAPNPDAPPLYLDLPSRNGAPRPEVLAELAANAPLAMLAQHVSALSTYDALALDIGDADELLEGNRGLDMLLTRFRVEHSFEVYEGDHVNRIAARFEGTVLPFFSERLAKPD
jgi:S-formylglutathione hydrolase FrmB